MIFYIRIDFRGMLPQARDQQTAPRPRCGGDHPFECGCRLPSKSRLFNGRFTVLLGSGNPWPVADFFARCAACRFIGHLPPRRRRRDFNQRPGSAGFGQTAPPSASVRMGRRLRLMIESVGDMNVVCRRRFCSFWGTRPVRSCFRLRMAGGAEIAEHFGPDKVEAPPCRLRGSLLIGLGLEPFRPARQVTAPWRAAAGSQRPRCIEVDAVTSAWPWAQPELSAAIAVMEKCAPWFSS